MNAGILSGDRKKRSRRADRIGKKEIVIAKGSLKNGLNPECIKCEVIFGVYAYLREP